MTQESLSIVWSDMRKYYDSLDDEIEAMQLFVSKNPYPSLEKIRKILPKDQQMEYGNDNHVLCKLIYENITDDTLIAKYMKMIKQRGGTQATYANYYTLCSYSPLRANVITKSFAIAIIR